MRKLIVSELIGSQNMCIHPLQSVNTRGYDCVKNLSLLFWSLTAFFWSKHFDGSKGGVVNH